MSPTVLVDQGRARAVIRLPESPSPLLETAARELQEHLRAISGALLPVVRGEAESASGPEIRLGRTPRTEALLGPVDWSALAPDGVVLRATPGGVVLAGADRKSVV